MWFHLTFWYQTILLHIWHRQFQFCAGFNEHHELRQNICMNAKDTAWQCGQILSSSCCFDLFVYITKQQLRICPHSLAVSLAFVQIFRLISWCSLKPAQNWNWQCLQWVMLCEFRVVWFKNCIFQECKKVLYEDWTVNLFSNYLSNWKYMSIYLNFQNGELTYATLCFIIRQLRKYMLC